MPQDPERADEPAEAVEYSIDDLAAETRVPSRTIRFYQSKGALMPPEIRGRVAFYGEKHRERLKLIAQLQDKGLRMDAIADLATGLDKGELDLAEFFGVEAQIQAPWANDRPRTVTEAELYDLVGTKRAGLLADLQRAKLVERKGDVYLLQSPALLTLAMKLEAAGIDADLSILASEVLRKHLSRAAKDLVELFMKRSADFLGERDAAETVSALRPVGMEAVRVLFAREMERELRSLFESGKLTKLPRKSRSTPKAEGPLAALKKRLSK
jgi:DNA-binding transcriptional MerR regulator